MNPITRELVSDRRAPALRWTAVFAGATVAVALWLLLQMLGMGAGMAAIDLDGAGTLRSIGIGTGLWSLIAPLFSLFVGGLVAGQLAASYEPRVGVTHGFIAWAVAAIVGTIVTATVIGMLAGPTLRGATSGLALSNDVTVYPGLRTAEARQAAANAGTLLLGASMSLLVGMVASILGGMLSARKLAMPRGRRITREVPVVPPPPEPPANAPHVTA